MGMGTCCGDGVGTGTLVMGTGWGWGQRLWGWGGNGHSVHGDGREWGSDLYYVTAGLFFDLIVLS